MEDQLGFDDWMNEADDTLDEWARQIDADLAWCAAQQAKEQA